MTRHHGPRIAPSEITPRELFLNRRAAIAALGAAAWPASSGAAPLASTPWAANPGLEPTPIRKFTTYNNFYELGTAKEDPAENADLYRARPWKVMVDGACEKPTEFDVDDLLGLAPIEERVYRLRCVERWAMVVPWLGYPLARLIEQVRPTSAAKYVAFATFDPTELFPASANRSLPWPYVEGLRMDEAMHDLSLLTFGAYGEELLNQNGAPLRMVVPWKYGYKSIKALVRITLVEDEPPTSWNKSQPHEYGFYSNVNPEVDHPRWSQAKERMITDALFPRERPTEKFNGYATEVASLYAGMNLAKFH